MLFRSRLRHEPDLCLEFFRILVRYRQISFLYGRGILLQGKHLHLTVSQVFLRPGGVLVVLSPDFRNFPYVNPDAPKGGDITLSAVGTFDSFNPFIVRGNAAAGGQRVWETLLRNSVEEVATAYGALAEKVEVAPDKLSVAFTLRPEAKFQIGRAHV